LYCFLLAALLVRDFIQSALYDPNHGYFSRSGQNLVPKGGYHTNLTRLWIAEPCQQITDYPFTSSDGRRAYLRYLDDIYKHNEISWFTPVELFKPWNAHGIAEAIMRTANFSVSLKIYGIGGGSGTYVKCIMDYIMLNAPEFTRI
ncbi:arginine methyltransferase NDUFAF7, partial [Thalictrum thalictroides]